MTTFAARYEFTHVCGATFPLVLDVVGQVDGGHRALTKLTLDAVAAFQSCVQAGDGITHALKMRRRSAEREQIRLRQHERQPQREQRAHDDHGHEVIERNGWRSTWVTRTMKTRGVRPAPTNAAPLTD
ncbi:MAG: hypothetical protein IIB37_12685 [Gemmatimonadetes bacterium]|nr:hypothetical protein [Gemmatimonadota bacterium]